MQGIVYQTTGIWSVVGDENKQFYKCKIKGKFRIQGIKSTNPVAVGDMVEFDLIEKPDIGLIYNILPRKNYIVRKSVNLSKQAHIIAANIDLACVVISIVNPKTPLGFIDRFLVTAEAYHIPCKIIINKCDLISDATDNTYLNKILSIYKKLKYDCIQVSAITKQNISFLKSEIINKKTLFSGQSGVGKSSLLNSIVPELNIKTAQVSDFNQKGKHTTTYASMYYLKGVGHIIDTPGVKEFGTIYFDKYELSDYFKEFYALKSACKFRNCLHINEPGCAVKEALKNNKIALSRYDNYLYILQSDINK